MKALIGAKASWCKKNINRFTQDKNLLGVGLGPKETGGKTYHDKMAVKFFVRRKKKKGEKIAASEKLEIANQETDVVEMSPLRANGEFTQRRRPGIGGCSGCVVVPGLQYTGTLGLGVLGHSRFSDRTFIISNNHVLAHENQAKIGDPVIQPGSLDGGNAPLDVIGELYDYVRLNFADPKASGSPPPNQVDAACALVTRFGDFTREIFWIGYPKGWRDRASVEEAVSQGRTDVQKTGRTTGYTSGTISAVSFDGWIGYSTGDAFFEDQILIEPGGFSGPGDSGSCILDMEENVLGLLFAGSATHTIANSIEDALNQLSPFDFSGGRV